MEPKKTDAAILEEAAALIFVDPWSHARNLPDGIRRYQEHSQGLLSAVAKERDAWRARYHAAIGKDDPDAMPRLIGVPDDNQISGMRL